MTSIKATDSAGKRSKAAVTRLGLVCIGLAACTASADEVSPPKDQFFFPTGLAIAPDESRLFVTNANSELRYDSGSINVSTSIRSIRSRRAGPGPRTRETAPRIRITPRR